ncbi:hypothetical protein Syun_007615 [Stephania yunnanensis]|uniref:Uncharacterized protein n=1 Tax=Stephania yunnanensis TaxID=152371 RepID=A0AAP0Q0F3_9MAGN
MEIKKTVYNLLESQLILQQHLFRLAVVGNSVHQFLHLPRPMVMQIKSNLWAQTNQVTIELVVTDVGDVLGERAHIEMLRFCGDDSMEIDSAIDRASANEFDETIDEAMKARRTELGEDDEPIDSAMTMMDEFEVVARASYMNTCDSETYNKTYTVSRDNLLSVLKMSPCRNGSLREKKREAKRAVKWGMDLATFTAPQIKQILDGDVFEALVLVKRMGIDVREGRRRQFNYIGKRFGIRKNSVFCLDFEIVGY